MNEKKMNEWTPDNYNLVKKAIRELMNDNYENYVKAIISLEMGIDDIDILDKVYCDFMDDDDEKLINDNFYYIISKYME